MKNKKSPLNGLLVLDLTRVLAGPYATMVLNDLGARVIKIESPSGDDARQFGPFVKGKSTYFSSLNRNKESKTLNLKDKKEKNIFLKLLKNKNILEENNRPVTLEKLIKTKIINKKVSQINNCFLFRFWANWALEK